MIEETITSLLSALRLSQQSYSIVYAVVLYCRRTARIENMRRAFLGLILRSTDVRVPCLIFLVRLRHSFTDQLIRFPCIPLSITY